MRKQKPSLLPEEQAKTPLPEMTLLPPLLTELNIVPAGKGKMFTEGSSFIVTERAIKGRFGAERQ